MTYALFLCNRTMNMPRPWLEAGIHCITVDLQEADAEHPNRRHLVASVFDLTMLPSEPPIFIAAFPPCTNLAVSGARWFKDKGLRGLIDALQVVEACGYVCHESGAPYMIENPVSTLSTYWRKPDYTFDPCDYGDPYTKKTCLWTGNGFVMPPKNRVEPTEGSKMHRLPPSPERANLRSATPQGFANAVFKANYHAPAQAEV